MDSGQRGPSGHRAACVVPDFTPGYVNVIRRRLGTADFHALATTRSGKSAATDSVKVRITGASPPKYGRLVRNTKISVRSFPLIKHAAYDFLFVFKSTIMIALSSFSRY